MEPAINVHEPAINVLAVRSLLEYYCTAISSALHPPEVWEQFVEDVYSIYKSVLLEHLFHHNNFRQNVKFTTKEESNGELTFLDTSLKRNNGQIFVLVYNTGSKHILSHTYITANYFLQLTYITSSLFNTAYSIITNKDDLHQENAKLKQVLRKGHTEIFH